MSYSARGYAVIGVAILDRDMRRACAGKPFTERGCSHAYPPGAKFCPTCGSKTEVIRKSDDLDPGELMQPFELIEADDGDMTHVVCATDYKIRTDDICESSNSAMVPLPDRLADVLEYRDRLAAKLTPLGLWDASKFGLWAVGRGG